MRPNFAATARERAWRSGAGPRVPGAPHRRVAQGGTGRSPRRAQPGTRETGGDCRGAETAIGIAVLPFSDLSSAQGPGATSCEGMAEEIMNALAADRRDPRRSHRTSAFRAQKAGSDLAGSPARCPWATSSRAACGRRATAACDRAACGRSREAIKSASEPCDREASTSSRCRTRSLRASSRQSRPVLQPGEHKVRTRAAGRRPRGLPALPEGATSPIHDRRSRRRAALLRADDDARSFTLGPS